MNVKTGTNVDVTDKARTSSFIERQFFLPSTRGQKKFDWTFGIFLPLLCIAADPMVFRRSGLMGPLIEPHDLLFGNYRIFAYILGMTSMLALAAWLLWGERLGERLPFFGGLFFVASAASILVGLVLFPFSVIGSIVLIGALGFTPLFSTFVFLRAAVRVFDVASNTFPRRYIVRAASLAVLYALVVPYLLNSLYR